MPCSDSVTNPVRSPEAARLRRALRRVSRAKCSAVTYTSGATHSPIRPSSQLTDNNTAAVPTRVSTAGMRSVNRSSRLLSIREVSDTTRLVSSPMVCLS